MSFSDQLKSQVNIIDVIGDYVRLKRIGATGRYLGLCPFHTEKTPSFNVNGGHQFYKCFGCGVGGDVYKFVMEIEGLTFPETLKVLADKAGVAMPERHNADSPEERRREVVLEMHEIAASVFQDNLRGAQGAEARRYLESRGVSSSAIHEFRLGLSDPGGRQLTRRFEKYSAELVLNSGLVNKRQDGGELFDRFRGRLMFPIHNESGQVIAFGGRALRPEDEPKYLNSPETEANLYKKRQVVYNLHRAKMDARKHDRMVLVEGYMDVIAVYSAGVHEVVASCGTSLTNEQVRAIKRQTSHDQAGSGHVIVNFDSDTAGGNATEKSINLLLAEGLRVRVLELPGGLDPDEYIQRNGAEAYRAQLDLATSYFHWLAQRARGKFDMRSAEGRMDAFQFMWPALQQIQDRLERSTIANEIAEYLNVDRETVREQFRRIPKANGLPTKLHSVAATVPPNEKLLLSCLLVSEDARTAINHYLRQAEIMHLLEMRSVFEAMLAMDAEGAPFSLALLSTRVEPSVQRILTALSFSDLGMQEEHALEQALRCLTALEAKGMQAEQLKLRRRIRELEQDGKFEEAMQLANELDRVKKPPSCA